MKTTDIYQIKLADLLVWYSSHSLGGFSRSKTPIIKNTAAEVKQLYQRDYIVDVIQNKSICKTYPLEIIIPQRSLYAISQSTSNVESSLFDIETLSNILHQSSSARARQRCPIPFVSFGPLCAVRSATTSIPLETMGRNLFKTRDIPFYEVKQLDAMLLSDILGVRYVVDLMVENAKVKYGLTVTTSEKQEADGELYKNLDILTMPYPGVELFSAYHRKQYDCVSTTFEDALHPPTVEVKIDHVFPEKSSNLIGFEKFDLVTLTSNYLDVIVEAYAKSIANSLSNKKYTAESLNVHCISGYDRTPVFAAFIRLLTWADGWSHHSLKPSEVLFLTVGYDFFLFGHLLFERFNKNEDIIRFCFDFLGFLCSPKFRISHRIAKYLDSDYEGPEVNDPLIHDLHHLYQNCLNQNHEDFGAKLFEVRSLFIQVWDDVVCKLRRN
ncbi:hypothetical protein P9112_011601 [Eukaryota sp. TZLM1-RC]